MPDGVDDGGEVIGLVTFRKAALLTVEEKIAPSMTHQRLSQMAAQDAEFPTTQKVGTGRLVVWEDLRPYLKRKQAAAAVRDSRRRMPDADGSGDAAQ